MIGCVVVSSPPKAQSNLKALYDEKMSKFGLEDSAERYHELAVKARGLGFLDRPLSTDDAATSYFLGFINAKLQKWRQAELYFGECQNILRTLGVHKSADSMMSPQLGSLSNSASGEHRPTLDHVTQEVGRRIFWSMYLIASSTPALETFFTESIASTYTDMAQYPPLPTEADDAYIYPHHVVPPPATSVPRMVGFNALARMAFAKNASTSTNTIYGVENFNWGNQQSNIKQGLYKCYHIFNSLPSHLRIRSDASATAFPWDCYFEIQALDIAATGYMAHTPELVESRSRDRLGLDILKAEAFVSYLEASSSLIERSISLDERIEATSGAGTQSSGTFNAPAAVGSFHQTYQPQGMFPTGQEMMPSFSPPISGKFECIPPTTPARSPDWNENTIWTQREEVARELLSVFGGLGRLNFPMGRAGTDLVGPLALEALQVHRY